MSTTDLGSIADVIMGQSPPGDTYNIAGKGLPFFQGKSEFGRVSPTAVKWCTAPTRTARAGDILISVRAPVGPTNLADRDCCIGRGLAVIRAHAELVNRDYLWLFLRYSEASLAAKGQGSTFEAINGEDIRGLQIPLPALGLQRDIADRLQAQLFELEIAHQAALAQTKDIGLLRRRVLREMFAAVDDAPRKRLGDYAPTTSGSTPSRGVKAYWMPAEVPWVKTGEVAFAPIARTEEAVSHRALAECSLTLLPAGTVLVAMIGQGKTRGQSSILEIAATTNQNCFAIQPNDTWEPNFLFHWMMASYQDLRELSGGRGGSQSALNGALLNALEVPAPSRIEQAAIARRAQAALRDVEALAAVNHAWRIELERLPQLLLAQAFEN